MDCTVSVAGYENEPQPAPQPRADWARFMRTVCAGCRIDTRRSDDSES